jgi:outer membrane protein assembly factor BamB
VSTPPRKLWERSLGDGYSAVAVENGILYTGFRRGVNDVITALDAATGKTIWEFEYAARFTNAYSDGVGPGPYAMPQVIGDRLVTASGIGQIHSLDKQTGKPVWAKDMYTEFGGNRLDFGYACHALPYKDSLIVLAGGKQSALVKLGQRDGEVIWKKHSFQNAHSSPLLIDVGGQPQVVALGGSEVIGFDPESGEILWRHKHSTEHGLAVSTPVWAPGNLLFITSAYGTGSRVLRLTRSGARTEVEELWSNSRIQGHFGSVIAQGGVAYISSGHRGPVFLTAVELQTGRVLWQARDFSKAQLLHADGKLILLDEDGNLGLGVATPEKFQAIAKWPMLTRISWTTPTLAGTRLYIRDRQAIMALDLAARP